MFAASNLNLCWECQKNEPDRKPVFYVNAARNERVGGERNFCCDACETAYSARMEKLHGNYGFIKEIS